MSLEHDFFLGQEGMFVLPPEHIGPTGLSPELRAALDERGLMDAASADLFDAAFALYAERLTDLAARTTTHWFPPRAQHIAIAPDGVETRPYFQPFHRSAWLLYASDFDAARSTPEFLAFQLVMAERMGLLQQIDGAFLFSLSWWIGRDDAALADFAAGAEGSPRPDAEAYRALAAALPWVRDMHHELLNPPAIELPDVKTVQGTGLLFPRETRVKLDGLYATWRRTARGVAAGHAKVHAVRERNHADDFVQWLEGAAPRVILTGAKGRVVWDYAEPGAVSDVRAAVRGINAGAEASLRLDLERIAARSTTFLDSLADPESLSRPEAATADQNGLSYMHLTRREIAYNLREPGMRRLEEPAPPFERAMLAARTVHEWGHLAVDAGWVDVPAARAAEHAELRGELAQLLDAIVNDSPPKVRNVTRPALKKLVMATKGAETPGAALVDFALARVADFQANLISQRYLEPEEREAYVRNNSRSLVHDYPAAAFLHRLARYAYEYQYLRFSCMPDPRTFFLRTTWFGEQYLHQGVLSEERFDALFSGMGRVCDTYEVASAPFVGA